MGSGALAGVRVLDLTRLLPGAHLTLLLADLGADVVKIEDPRGGDPGRRLPAVPGGTSAYFQVLNRNKRSVTLDLRTPDAAPVLDALLAHADIVVESFRPQTADRLGVDAATLRGRHPRLIHASINGFGQTGPSVARAAHDINFEAITGLLTLRAPPEVPRMLIGDIGAAMNAAAGILAALYQRERTGAGAAVDVSIHEAALSWLLFPAAQQLVGDDAGDAIGLPVDGSHACYNIYRTADDRYLALGALEPKFWEAFCQRIGRADLVPLQYASGAGGAAETQARVLSEVRALMLTRPRAEWLGLFAGIDVCLTPVNTVPEALADPDLRGRGAIARHGGSTYITTPISIARPVDVQPAPALGAHTDEVLDRAGIDEAARANLRARGII
jgi:crotonobetainyl-CoA:carnitine CoA-transferase CaiB-like acyl-CoA transferase